MLLPLHAVILEKNIFGSKYKTVRTDIFCKIRFGKPRSRGKSEKQTVRFLDAGALSGPKTLEYGRVGSAAQIGDV